MIVSVELSPNRTEAHFFSPNVMHSVLMSIQTNDQAAERATLSLLHWAYWLDD